MTQRWFTVAEAAEVLRLHPESLRRAVRAGQVPGARRVLGGRTIRIPASYVEGKTGGELVPPRCQAAGGGG